ncbi:hypothetical protein TWF718_002893 [Orbilia javanica]|uniref:Uncharacterized protein n=1 Tax=Orbilia javanica TaxID=47235 RepID=A0AAN8R846_9PEZI
MHLSSSYCSAALALLLQAAFVNGYALRLERNVTDENSMLEREWYNLKAHHGVKKCAAASSLDGFPVSGFSITNFGPEDAGFREQEAEPKRWRDPLGWMGFWKNTKCQGLPNIIVHFYPVPYTRQAIYFPKLIDFAEDIDLSDVSFARYGDIPFGSIWFYGNRQIPEGSVAVRKSRSRGAATPTYEDEFHIFPDAVRVLNVGPNNDRSLVDSDDHRWDGSGDVVAGGEVVTSKDIKIPDGINISANEELDRVVQVILGLVRSRDGHGPILKPPLRYQNLLSGGDEEDDDEGYDEDDDEDDDEDPAGGGTQIQPGSKSRAEELAAQQAAYRSLQEQSGRLGSVPSTSQNTGVMQTEPPPQAEGAIEEEQYTGPPISDFQKTRSRLEAQEMLATLLERYPNWAELTGQERLQRFNEYQDDKKKRESQLLNDLVANTPNWEQLSPQERYRLYQHLDLSSNRARVVYLEQEAERVRQEERRLREEAQGQQERTRRQREQRSRDEKAANDQTVSDFVKYLNVERAKHGLPGVEAIQNSRPNPVPNNPPPQQNAGGNAGSNSQAPRPNTGFTGNAGSNNPVAHPGPNSGGNVNQNNPRPSNPTGNTFPSNPQSQPNSGGSIPQGNQYQFDSGGNIYRSNPQSQPNSNRNMPQDNEYQFDSGGNIYRSNPQPQPNSGGNTNQNNPGPYNPFGNNNPYDPRYQLNVGGSMNQNNPNTYDPRYVNTYNLQYQSNPSGNTQNNQRPYNPGGNYYPTDPRYVGGNSNPNAPYPINPGGNNGGNTAQNQRPPRRWEYGSRGPGPRNNYYLSNNLGSGINTPSTSFYQNYGPMSLDRQYSPPVSGNNGPLYPAPDNNNARNRNLMEEEFDERVEEENLIGTGDNGLDFLQGSQGQNMQNSNEEDDEFSLYQFGPRRVR